VQPRSIDDGTSHARDISVSEDCRQKEKKHVVIQKLVFAPISGQRPLPHARSHD
jgi:hypothetical protein